MAEDEIRAERIEAEVKISTRRIELVDDEGNLTAVLDGGEKKDDGERDFAGLTLYGPDGPASSASIVIDGDSGEPAIHLQTVGGSLILVTFGPSGVPVIHMKGEDGRERNITP